MWLSRLLNHLRGNRVSNEIEREMEFHIAERADDLAAAGMSPRAARAEARRRFGNVTRQKEQTRDRDLFAWLDSLIGDVRYAIRSLRAAPVFAAVAVLSLALGIGANTAIFSIIDAVLLKSLPVSHPEQLVRLERGNNGAVVTNPLWEAIRDRQNVFSGIFAFGHATFDLANGGEAQRITGVWVSGDYFSTLGVHPEVGRLIARDDDRRGCAGVAVLSHAFWENHFASNPAVVGRSISFDGHPFRILGVADARFGGVDVGRPPQVFVPLCSETVIRGANSQLDQRSSWFLRIIGRPRDGLTLAQLNARLAVLSPPVAEATLPPDWSVEGTRNFRRALISATPAPNGFSDVRRAYTKALYVLMAIVALVLLIACANVANLLLARATARQREIAVRLALGAGRGRIARQLVTESLLLATLGASCGVAFAAWGSRLLVGLLSRGDDVLSLDLAVDRRVLLFTIAITTVTGLLFGVVPAWRSGRVDPQSAMKAQGRGLAQGFHRFTMGKALVIAQVALSLVLIVGAGLLMSSWRRLATLDPGFRRDGILLVDADVRATKTAEDQRLALQQRVLDRLRALPGVRAASSSQVTPVGQSTWNDIVRVDGFTPRSEDDALVWANAVSDGFFSTLGIPLLVGRDFGSRDDKSAAAVAIVSRSMAAKFFGTANVVGRRFQTEQGDHWSPPIEIVGVVGDSKYRSLRDTTPPIMYFPRAQVSATAQDASYELRTDEAPIAIVPSVKSALAEVDPRIRLDITTLDRQLSESLVLPRTIATLSGFFGGLALLLSMVGLYGVMAYMVARRRNEIGVRIALGALRGRVIRLVLGETARIVVVGIVLGIALSFALTRLVQSFLYGLEPRDPRTLAGAALLLTVVGVAASVIPALRAARMDPVAALRED
ncbi:MAG TPA: ABC transporter permease [Gemmatimonadaceae bacterium]|nr:ABC transporter permease [Gemmatimonadaceae bacterium]